MAVITMPPAEGKYWKIAWIEHLISNRPQYLSLKWATIKNWKQKTCPSLCRSRLSLSHRHSNLWLSAHLSVKQEKGCLLWQVHSAWNRRRPPAEMPSMVCTQKEKGRESEREGGTLPVNKAIVYLLSPWSSEEPLIHHRKKKRTNLTTAHYGQMRPHSEGDTGFNFSLRPVLFSNLFVLVSWACQ